MKLVVSIAKQTMFCYENGKIICSYLVSTAVNGIGFQWGSEQTPLGMHIVRAKIGQNCPPNSVFVARRLTGEIYSADFRQKYPDRDWILTRILWLSGLEKGINRLGQVDTMRRMIYIHGCPDDVELGKVGSHGCICMNNQDVIELFDRCRVYDKVEIVEY